MRRGHGYAQPHNVKYWSIGNENYGEWEAGAKTVEQWGYFVRESAKLMRFVDPSIKLFAAATADRNWTMPLLERAGRYLDYISIHGYWDPLWQENNVSDYLTCMMRSVQPEAQILNTIEILKAANLTGRVKIAFDEWNLRGWHHPGHNPPAKDEELLRARDENDLNETYTMADACFSACFLNACIRQAEHVHMANMAPVVNARGPLFVHSQGIVKRTTFHVMKMYNDRLQRNAVGANIACASLDHAGASVPVLDAIVTRSDDGRTVSAAIVNRHPDATVACRLAIKGIARDSEATLTTLSGDSPDAYNDVDMPNRVAPETHHLAAFEGRLSLPPHSVTIVSMKG
jgi:alpha-N-arabinofuranosidase